MMTTSNEHNNAPAVPQGYPVLPDYVEDAIERCKNMPGHPPAWVDMMRSMRKALGAATTAPAPAQGEPFGYFRAEPFGWTDCAATDEGAIALYEHPAKPAQEVGLTGYIPLLEEVASSLEDYKNDAPWGSWDRERLERLYAIIAALRAKGGK